MNTVAVVGAGITGITTAYYLAKAGFRVTVYEQERYPAMQTSFANGGQISVSNSEVWTTWSNVFKGIHWMFTKDAPLLIKPKLDLAQWQWMMRFLKHTINRDYYKNTVTTIELGLEARALYDQICQEETLNFDRSNCGILHFYKDEKYWSAANQAMIIYGSHGLDRLPIDHARMIELDSNLSDIQGIVGASYTPSDWTGDIHKFCIELGKVLENKLDVVFVNNKKIEKLNDLEHYGAIVLCAGIGSVKLAKSVGDSLSIYPVKGYSITINNVDSELLPKVSLLDDQAKIVTASLGNRFRVAGTAELAGENYDIRRDRIEPLLKWVHTNFPKIDTSNYSSWACLRPMTPNMLPIVRESKKRRGLYYNTGHGHLGWTLAPVTAKQIVNIILEKSQ